MMIEAGALLKDTLNNKVLAQVKMKNIGGKTVSSCKVSIKAYENNSNEVEGVSDFSYLDVNAKAGESFGNKTPVYLPEQITRSYSAFVSEVVFDDGTVLNVQEDGWRPVPDRRPVTEELSSEQIQLLSQEIGHEAKFVPEVKDGLFLCPCGEINLESVERCNCCGNSVKSLNGLKSWIEEIKARKEEERIELERIAEQRREQRRIAAKKLKRIIAITAPIVVACIAFLIVLTTVIIPQQKLNKAMSLLDAGDYDEAYALLEEIGNNDAIASSKYDRAVSLIDSGNYEAAYLLLDGINYKNSKDLQKSIKPQYQKVLLSEAKIGSYVVFGAYEQDNNTSNGKEDIEWIVLVREGDRVLLVSRYALDCQKYNTSYISVTWETCSLREWLNGTFLNAAFSENERAMIPSVTVSADKNPIYSTSPGNSTTDQVFLLSITEAEKYFRWDSRQCQGTAYCYAQGADKAGTGNCWWWLRSPGEDSSHAAIVSYDGSVLNGGSYVFHDNKAVRPALWIDLGH
ncbi:MAG: tetratricopeptide repeat protein [Eubacteriaceae bacterium]|nr:tetratricopeptide repeat protein [Eubacteriaceae bacterium]